MKTLAIVLSITIGMLTAVACGKPDKVAKDKDGRTNTTAGAIGGAVKASCDMTGELGRCNEYKGGTSFGVEKSLCEGFKGKFSLAACPTAGQVGWCSLSDGEVRRYYGASAKDHAYTAAEAQSDCESDLLKGRYNPAPGR